MVFEDNFLRLTVTVLFRKNEFFKNLNFLIPFQKSISYNNAVVTKQICFSPTFSKSWVHISDNIAGAIGRPQYY